MIKIDKGVPMPEISKGAGRPRKYPYQDLEPGDSFLVEGMPDTWSAYVATRNYGMGQVPRWKVSRRREGATGFRIWRLE